MNKIRLKRKIKYKNFLSLHNNNFEKNNILISPEFNNNSKNVIILSIFLSIIILFNLILNCSLFKKNYVYSYKKYKIGSIVYLMDNSKWIVLDSKKNEVKLLEYDLFDLNNDYIIDTNDMVLYSEISNSIKEFKSKINIELLDINLINSNDYVFFRDSMKYDYYWNNDNFLAGKNINSYWIVTDLFNNLFIINEHGCYELSNSSEYNYLRFVIEIDNKYLKN